jgi:hypothetical protein
VAVQVAVRPRRKELHQRLPVHWGHV